MNKTELIEAMAADAGITIKQAKLALESLLSNIGKQLKKGNRVSFVGFGSWSVSRRSAREGRNPSTGQTIKIAAKNAVKFKAASKLASPVNNRYKQPHKPRKGDGLHPPKKSSHPTRKRIKKVPRKKDDYVNFSVMTPKNILAGSICIVDIWAYLFSDKNKVESLANDLDRGKTIGIKAGVDVNLGTIITVNIKIQDFTIDEPTDFIHWDGVPTNISFIVRCPKNLKSNVYPGKAEMSVAGLKLCTIPFMIKTVDNVEDEILVKSDTKPEYVQKAFASYSSKDRDEVMARIQGMEKMNPKMNIYLDVMKLRSGNDWEKKLMKYVPKQDAFYLFWSKSASQSQWVDREWRLALRKRGIDYIDPVPLDDPRDAPAPKELSSLHFNNKYLAHIKYERLRKSKRNIE